MGIVRPVDHPVRAGGGGRTLRARETLGRRRATPRRGPLDQLAGPLRRGDPRRQPVGGFSDQLITGPGLSRPAPVHSRPVGRAWRVPGGPVATPRSGSPTLRPVGHRSRLGRSPREGRGRPEGLVGRSGAINCAWDRSCSLDLGIKTGPPGRPSPYRSQLATPPRPRAPPRPVSSSSRPTGRPFSDLVTLKQPGAGPEKGSAGGPGAVFDRAPPLAREGRRCVFSSTPMSRPPQCPCPRRPLDSAATSAGPATGLLCLARHTN